MRKEQIYKHVKHICLFTFILTLFAISCGELRIKLYSDRLLCLEDSLGRYPKNVFETLVNMDTIPLSDNDKGLYYLLLNQAKEMTTGELPRPDGGLSLAYDVFVENGDSLHLCRLYCFSGKIFRMKRAWGRAAACYSLAEQLAENDRRTLFQLKTEQGHFYRFKMQPDTEETKLREALDIAFELQDSILISTALHSLSDMFLFYGKYDEGKDLLIRIRNFVPDDDGAVTAGYYKNMGRIYIGRRKPDSALFYIDSAIRRGSLAEQPSYALLKGSAFMEMNRTDSALHYFSSNFDSFSLLQKMEAVHNMHLLYKKTGDSERSMDFLAQYSRYKDSVTLLYRKNQIENIKSFQEYELQRRKILGMKRELMEHELRYYRFAILFLCLCLISVAWIFRILQHRRKLELALQSEKLRLAEITDTQQRTEMELIKEQRDRKELENAKLRQSFEFHKRLNELCIPVITKGTNSLGAIHLTESEWEGIVLNTVASFEDFSYCKIKSFPALHKVDVRFCCLVKMEFSMELLAAIYHIAKGSISRRKMRLKEKMGIEGGSFDDFIKNF